MTVKDEYLDARTRHRQELVAAGGLLALAASSCCILPLLLFSLGVSGAWIGKFTQLAPYQPYFVTATLLFLGVGYWLVYRSRKRACTRSETCARPLSNRIVKGTLVLATLLVVAALGPRLHRPLLSQFVTESQMNKLVAHAALVAVVITSPAARAADRTITLTVENMYCAACPSIVKGSLRAVPGVAEVAVSYKDKTATITYDDTKADVNQLISATTKAGYPSSPKS